MLTAFSLRFSVQETVLWQNIWASLSAMSKAMSSCHLISRALSPTSTSLCADCRINAYQRECWLTAVIVDSDSTTVTGQSFNECGRSGTTHDGWVQELNLRCCCYKYLFLLKEFLGKVSILFLDSNNRFK